MADKRRQVRVQGAWAAPAKKQPSAQPGKSLWGFCVFMDVGNPSVRLFISFGLQWTLIPVAIRELFKMRLTCLMMSLKGGSFMFHILSQCPQSFQCAEILSWLPWLILDAIEVISEGFTGPCSVKHTESILVPILRLFLLLAAAAGSCLHQTPGQTWRNKEHHPSDREFVFKEPQQVNSCFFFNSNKDWLVKAVSV